MGEYFNIPFIYEGISHAKFPSALAIWLPLPGNSLVSRCRASGLMRSSDNFDLRVIPTV